MDGLAVSAVASLSIWAVVSLVLAFVGLIAGIATIVFVCRKAYNYIKRPRAFEVDLTGVKFK